MERVFFIIPNFNGKTLLEKCLPSVFKTIEKAKVKAEIIVVDNGSNDGSVKMINGLIKDSPFIKDCPLRLIANNENLGFAKAVNQALRQAQGETFHENANYKLQITNYNKTFVVVLNNDVTLSKNWLENILKTIDKDNLIAAVQGRNLTADGKKIEGTGLIYFLKGKCLNQGNGEINDPKKYGREEEIWGCSAAGVLYRLSALKKAGFFDEDFFAFEEDVDLALRFKTAGLKSFYNPKAVAFHLGGATIKKMGNLRARMDAQNWIFIIIKNYPLKILIRYFPQIFIERLRNLSGLVKQTIRSYGLIKSVYMIPLSILLTYGEVLIKIPKMIRKRKNLSFLDVFKTQ